MRFFFLKTMIRKATIDDFKTIKKIEKGAFHKFAYSDDEIMYMLKTAQTLIYENNEPMGYLSFYIEDSVCHIESIGILPKYKGQGIGTELMKYLEKMCKENKKNKIVLEVRYRNTNAIKFYKKLGYVEKRILKNYYMMSYRKSRDAIFMEKIISGPEPEY